MPFVRSIGRWTMTALVINCIVGAGIFGMPGELIRLLGRASPFAMIFAALGMGVIMACIAEVASQFSEPGGPYYYVRTAFGRFLSIQVGWFHLLSVIGGLGAVSSLFVSYFSSFLPFSVNGWERSLLLAIVISVPTMLNYLGVRRGATLSNVMTVAKLSPLVLLIVLGLARFGHQPVMIHSSEILSSGPSNWLAAMLALVFAYGGWEDGLIISGEIREPRQTIPFGLGTGLFACATIYMLLQFIIVASIGTRMTERPLQDTAMVLVGRGGATFVTIAVLIATYGYISAGMLSGPRLAYSLAAKGDFPSILGRLHPRFHTPAVAIIFFGFAGWLLASSGTFLWIAMLSAGSMIVVYGACSISLMRLRKLRPNADAIRIPVGPLLSILAVGISILLITGLKRRDLLLMCVTALIAAANWVWARRRHLKAETEAKALVASVSAP